MSFESRNSVRVRNRKLKYLVGSWIGNVHILEYELKKSYYYFQCKCGNKFSGTISTCEQKNRQLEEIGFTGCTLCVNKYKRSIISEEKYFNPIYKMYRKGAIKRNLEFNLSLEECIDLYKSKCFYCNSPQSNSMKVGKVIVKYNGIDRLNNSEGYYTENVVPCCKLCNYAKNATDYVDFINHINKIYSNLQRPERQLVDSSESKQGTSNLYKEEDDMV